MTSVTGGTYRGDRKSDAVDMSAPKSPKGDLKKKTNHLSTPKILPKQISRYPEASGRDRQGQALPKIPDKKPGQAGINSGDLKK